MLVVVDAVHPLAAGEQHRAHRPGAKTIVGGVVGPGRVPRIARDRRQAPGTGGFRQTDGAARRADPDVAAVVVQFGAAGSEPRLHHRLGGVADAVDAARPRPQRVGCAGHEAMPGDLRDPLAVHGRRRRVAQHPGAICRDGVPTGDLLPRCHRLRLPGPEDAVQRALRVFPFDRAGSCSKLGFSKGISVAAVCPANGSATVGTAALLHMSKVSSLPAEASARTRRHGGRCRGWRSSGGPPARGRSRHGPRSGRSPRR